MSREEDYRKAYVKAAAAIEDAMDILRDMHDDGEECKFNGGDGCLACLAQSALMEAGRGKE